MNQFAYLPGAWQFVVETGGVVAVPADMPVDRVETLHRMLAEGAPQLTDVIDVLSGGSIAALGSFAVALTAGDAVRLAVRGPVSIRVGAGDDDELVSGAEISTWTERFVADVQSLEVAVDDPASERWYPIRSGAVLAAVVRRGERSDAGAATDASGGADAAEEPIVEEPIVEEPIVEEPIVEEPRVPETPDAAEAESPAIAEVPTEAPVDTPDFATLIPAELADSNESASGDEEPPVAELPPAPVPPAPPAPPAQLGDHDGATISAAEMRRLRGEATPAPADPEAPTAVMPSVDAPASHGTVALSTGQRLTLDRTVIIGRRPRATRASGETMPHLVAVESPQQDISRSHLEIRPEVDSVVVIDLHTTNGSTLLRPGADPVRLHPGEHTLVLDGDTVDLGDGVTARFEGLT